MRLTKHQKLIRRLRMLQKRCAMIAEKKYAMATRNITRGTGELDAIDFNIASSYDDIYTRLTRLLKDSP